MHDVVVVGGGLAGTVAALAARRAGASVALASRSWGATAVSSGALDLACVGAGTDPAAWGRDLQGHIADIVASRPRHPFGVLGRTRAMAALGDGYAILRQSLAGGGLAVPDVQATTCNAYYPSSLGLLAPAAGALLPHQGFDLVAGGRWAIVQFDGDSAFDAERVGRGIAYDAARLGYTQLEMHTITVPLPAAQPAAMARAFDDQALLQSLAAALAGKVHGCAGVLLPAVLGLKNAGVAVRYLAEAIGRPVVETLAHMPSVPGIRLQRALEQARQQAGVRPLGEVVDVAVAPGSGHIAQLRTAEGLDVKAGALVLCTGRFLAGGVRSYGSRCVETLLQLPVVTELGPLGELSLTNVVRDTPNQSHPLMTAGIQVNADAQPMREGRVAHPNLFAAGMLVGGFASRFALCADGVALSTGALAGQGAAVHAGGGRVS